MHSWWRRIVSAGCACALVITLLIAAGAAPTPVASYRLQEAAVQVSGYRGDAARTGRQPGPGPVTAPAERWRFAVPVDPNDPMAAELADLLVLSTPAVAAGTVYAGGFDGALYAVDVATGALRWRLETGAIGAVDGIVVADRSVYAGVQGGVLLAADAASGEERWRVELGGSLGADVPLPAVADGVVYAGGGEGILVAVDAGSGEERWQIAVGGVTLGAPAVSDGLVVVTAAADAGGANAELVAVDAEGSTERWRIPVGSQPLHAAPAVTGGLVVVPGEGPEGTAALLALDAASGEERWRFDTGGFVVGNAAAADGRVYVATNHALIALDGATGQEAWRAEGIETGLLSAPGPVVADGTVYLFAGQTDALAGTETGEVVAVEAASGTERWRHATGFAPGMLVSWDVAVGDGLVFVPGTGVLLAIG